MEKRQVTRLDRASGFGVLARRRFASRPSPSAPRPVRLGAGLLALGLGVGCSGSQSGAASDSAQSLSEYDLARDAYARDQIRQSLEHVEKALDLDADNADAAYLGAIIMLTFCARDETSTDCRFDEAEKFARKALEADEEMRDAANTLGVILIHQRRYAEAIAALEPLSKDILYGSPEKAWGNLGWAYLEKGEIEKAIDALRRSVAAQPMFCVGQYRLGLAYEKKGELGAAREALTRALDTDRPECSRLQDAYDARARIHDKQGMVEQARADLERCRDISATTSVGQRCAAQLKTLQ